MNKILIPRGVIRGNYSASKHPVWIREIHLITNGRDAQIHFYTIAHQRIPSLGPAMMISGNRKKVRGILIDMAVNLDDYVGGD